MTHPVEDDELRAYREAQLEEYGQWVAKGPIYVGNARAYNEGDPVPASNVEAYKYDEMGLVVKATTKAGEEAAPTDPDAGSGAAAVESAEAAQATSATARTSAAKTTSRTRAGGNG